LKEESSFSEEKEAKRLLSLRCGTASTTINCGAAADE
jgi:hypothetical protein